jgi:tetratricopeptide (TPR) repeat protein
MTSHELLDKANAAKAKGDYKGAIFALTELIKKGPTSVDARELSSAALGAAHMERAECFEHLNNPTDAYCDYMEALAYAPLAASDDARKAIYLRLLELCRKMDDELYAVMFGLQAILAEAVLRIHERRGEELARLRAQADERVAALLGPAVDGARRTALQALVHKYIDSDDMAIDVRVVEFELPEAMAKVLGKKPDDMYGEPTSGRRI